MKKLLTFFILLIFNLKSFAQPISLPYYQDFESNDSNWTAEVGLNGWNYGTPGGSAINTAASGSKAWYTKITAKPAEIWQTAYYVTSPVFDITGRTNSSSNLLLSFKQSLNLAHENEASTVEYSIDGSEWQTLGGYLSGTNWYNNDFFAYYEGWSAINTGWRTVSHQIPLTSVSTSVQIRIVYHVDFDFALSDFAEGIAIDDFSLFEIEKPKVSAKDSLALVALYNSTRGDDWKRNDNWLKGNVETWYGIKVLNGHEIFSVNLVDNNLSGNIPAGFTKLDAVHISLDRNNLSGAIPSEIGDMYMVRSITLSYNQLSGLLPKELSKLFFITHVDISNNQITGSIPTEFGTFQNLWTLYLNNNKLTGVIPNLMSSQELGPVHLENNELNAILPQSRSSYLVSVLNNKMNFDGLEAFVINATNSGDNMGGSNYYEQDSIGTVEVHNINGNTSIKLEAKGAGNSSANRYQWYLNGSSISPVSTSPFLKLESVACNFSGKYYCAVTNDNVPYLTLWTRFQWVRANNTVETPLYRINCGGETAIKDASLDWAADSKVNPYKYFVATGNTLTGQNNWWNHNNSTYAPNDIFDTYRVGWGTGLKYNFPVEDGTYKVDLYFAANSSPILAKGTTCDIKIEKSLVIKDLNIYKNVGYDALVKSIVVKITDGVLNLQLMGKGDYPQISGIQISSLTGSSSIARISEIEAITVVKKPVAYPNPNFGTEVFLELPGVVAEDVKIEIADQKNLVVFSKAIRVEDEKVKIDFSGKLNRGIYFIKIYSNGLPTVLKFIKE